MPTQYHYNTLNQVIAQQSPDGGRTDFWYDRLGRLAISRNAKQRVMSGANSKYYSYTKYDFLGRITEVGQVKDTSATTMGDVFTRNPVNLDNWHTNLLAHREQVTNTVYDTPYDFFGLAPDNTVLQQNLRNRVSFVKYSDLPGLSEAYDHASFYSYDIHGNVDTLVQDYGIAANRPNMMNKNGNRWKKIVYEYDLISGKVNQVTYQPKFADQWTHRYFYDAENRLTEVQTSVDNYTWDREAKYEYYLHGPLARTTLGQEQVQGIDYAYTLQGWLKGINSAAADTTNDMGGDARSGLNKYVGRDALGFALNYFDGEYKPIKAGVTPFPSYRGGNGTSLPDNVYRPLYNGNISSALYNIRKFEENGLRPYFYNYQYDQLNRFVGQDKYDSFFVASNSFMGSWSLGASFRERVSYDANGNIQRYLRHSLSDLEYWAMDSLSYAYYPGTNQLQRVRDNVPKDRYGSQSYDKVYDIDDQDSVYNYKYDSIGNLIEDKAEKITSIKWNVYGKITEIRRNASITDQNTTFWTKYKYDAQGNRIAKEWLWYEKEDRSYINLPPGYQKNYTWYVRDAQGNLLSTYSAFTRDTLPTANMAKLWLQQEDVQIYGSSRLGMLRPENRKVDDLDTVYVPGPGPLFPYTGTTHSRGIKQYELANHLGNVLTVLSDRKIGVYSGSSLKVDTLNNVHVPVYSYYEAEKLAAYDYYPFGMISRMNMNDGRYRFGFNGKENDNEVKGFGGQVDFGSRVYDPRLGRFFSVDPRSDDSPGFSPFSFGANSPIYLVDFLGEYPEPFLRTWFKNYAQTQLGLSTNKKVGDFYEKLVVTSLHKGDKLVVHNTFLNFPSDYRRTVNAGVKPIDVRPDAIAGKLGVATQKGPRPITLERIPTFYEAKLTGATLTKNYRRSQLSGMIEVLGKQRHDNGATFGQLFLIVTQDMKISDDLLKFAADRSILIKVSILMYDKETNEFSVSDAHAMNMGYIYQNGKNLTVAEVAKMAKVNKYKPVKKEEVTNAQSSDASDPDPATYDDN